MDDLEQEFALTSVTLDNTARVPSHKNSAQPPDVRQLETSSHASEVKNVFDRPVALSTMSTVTDLSEPPRPNYIKRFGHRDQPAIIPVISHNLPKEDTSEDDSPDSPASSVDIITDATTRPTDARPSGARPSDARPSADDRLIDTESDSSDLETDHHDTSDDAVAGQRQSSSNTGSYDSEPQNKQPPTIDQPREASRQLNNTSAEQPATPLPRSETPDEVGEDEDDDDNSYHPTNNKFYFPGSMQTKALGRDDSHSNEAELKTPHSTLHSTSEQPFSHPRTGLHQPQPSQFSTTESHQQPQSPLPKVGNLAEKLEAWRDQDTDRHNEFIAILEKQCQLQEDKKRLMIENRDLRLEVAHLKSVIDVESMETTSESPSRLDSSTAHHLDDSHEDQASFEYNPNVPRPPFDSRSYMSNANIPHVRNKWQSKEDKKALRIGTKVYDWQDVSRKKNGERNTKVMPRLNGPNLGAYNKTSPMRNKKALLYNADGLRVDAPMSKPQEPLLRMIKSMNEQQRFCHADYRGR